MDIIKKHGIVISVILIIGFMVLLRLSGMNFKPDARKHLSASLNGSNIITSEQVADLGGDELLINLDASDISWPNIRNIEKIEPGSILTRESVKKIRKNKGPVILYSDNSSVSAGTWMVLSQIGLKNIYILTETKNNEIIKYEFRPDTMFGRNP